MNISIIVLAGLIAIVGIFILGFFFQIDIQNKMSQISEYHSLMGIPATNNLQKILIDFERMHSTLHEFIASNDIRFVRNYYAHLDSLYSTLGDYSDLTFVQNSNGEYLANTEMRNEMLSFVTRQQTSLNQFNQNAKTLFSYYGENVFDGEEIENILFLIDDEDIKFREILIENLEMEINGITSQQESLNKLQQESQNIFLIFTSIEISLIILIVFLLWYLLRKNIISLIHMTNEISKGNLTQKIDMKTKNEFTPLKRNIERMQQNLQNSQNMLLKKEKLSAIGELSARLAHDLRNPLNIIRNAFEIVQMTNKDKIDTRTRMQFNFVHAAINRMSHQIDNVLDFVKIPKPTLQNSNLNEIIQSSVSGLDIPKEISLHLPQNKLILYCDPILLEITLKNLILNSIQAINNQGSITIRTNEDANNVYVELEDSGIGISDEHLSKIFDPLFTTKQRGTGLGLASCQSIIKAHGGKIIVKNNPTRFTIELPKKNVN